jgi:hypothetical protein
MELSVFTYKTSKSIPFNMPSRFKDIVFVKLGGDSDGSGGKVYIEATIVGVGGGNSIYMPYDLLMRHRYLKHYYELSRKAIGKPNLNADYYGSEDPEKCKTTTGDVSDVFVDTMYIIEDIATNTIEAKKGNSYRSFNLEKMKNAEVATVDEIMEFNAIFKERYLYDRDANEDFDERIAIYTALVDKL